MKYAIAAFLVTGLAAASGTLTGYAGGSYTGLVFPASDNLLDSYAYDPSQILTTWPASYNDNAVVDDIPPIPFPSIDITAYSCWSVTTGSVPASSLSYKLT